MTLEGKDISQYKSNKVRKKYALISFYVLLGVVVLNLIVGFLYYSELNSFLSSDGQEFNQTIELANSLLIIFYAIAYIGTIVGFLMWFFQSYANLKRIGIQLNHSVNMSIFGFIIPILNLFRPLKITKEIDLEYDYIIKALDENHQINMNNYTVYSGWFIMYWVVNVYDRYSARLNTDTIEGLIEFQEYDLVGNVLMIIAIILTILMIKTIGKLEDKFEDLSHIQTINQINESEVI